MHCSVCRDSRVREDRAAPIVQQDDVKLPGPIARMNAGPGGVIGVHPLAGSRSRQRLEKDFEVAETGNDLFDTDDGDEHIREREAHAAIAFGLDDADAAGIGNHEIAAGNSDFDAKKLFTEIGASRGGKILGPVAEIWQLHFALKDLPHLLPILVQRRNDEVRGTIFAQLDDQFGKVGLVGAHAVGLQVLIEPDLFRGHRLNLDDFFGSLLLDQVEDNCVGFGCVARPVDLPAGPRAILFKLGQVVIQMTQGMGADLCSGLSKFFPIGKLRDDLAALGLNDIGGMQHVLANLRVLQQIFGSRRKIPVRPRMFGGAHWEPLCPCTRG